MILSIKVYLRHSALMTFSKTSFCYYTEGHSAEFCVLFIVMLNVITLIVVLLVAIMLIVMVPSYDLSFPGKLTQY